VRKKSPKRVRVRVRKVQGKSTYVVGRRKSLSNELVSPSSVVTEGLDTEVHIEEGGTHGLSVVCDAGW
jgi:hypothetical protein